MKTQPVNASPRIDDEVPSELMDFVRAYAELLAANYLSQLAKNKQTPTQEPEDEAERAANTDNPPQVSD